MADNVTVVIIDDEAPARDIIKTYLQGFPNITVVAECSNGFDGFKAIQMEQPDLIFLDIQMPKLTGFEMLELLEKPPAIIFSTAYDQYALKAFDVCAADYLLKPYSRQRFEDALQRALQIITNKTKTKQLADDLLTQRAEHSEHLERIVVKSDSSIYIIPVDKLLWLEAQGDYVMLHTKDGDFLKQKTMASFEKQLDPRTFVRIHRSYMVRIALIRRIELFGKDTHRVILRNGTQLPVSKSGQAKLKELLR